MQSENVGTYTLNEASSVYSHLRQVSNSYIILPPQKIPTINPLKTRLLFVQIVSNIN